MNHPVQTLVSPGKSSLLHDLLMCTIQQCSLQQPRYVVFLLSAARSTAWC